MGMVCSWPCGVVGGVVLIGGSAIAKTVNTITVDAEAQTITYSQKARKERKQTLGFGQVAHLRLSQQQFNPSFFLQRMHEVMVLECVTDEQTYWLVDSAADLEALRPTANALTAILGKELVFDKHPGT